MLKLSSVWYTAHFLLPVDQDTELLAPSPAPCSHAAMLLVKMNCKPAPIKCFPL